jgi:hypothetical protein
MEHTFSLHDSAPAGHTPDVEPFELPAPYDPPPAPFESTPPYEAPASLHAFPVAESAAADDGWVQEDVHEEETAVEHHGSDADAVRRVVLRLTGGETVELSSTRSADEAIERGRDAVRRIAQAEASGEWPEFDGRFLRPDQIVSVDVQVAD